MYRLRENELQKSKRDLLNQYVLILNFFLYLTRKKLDKRDGLL